VDFEVLGGREDALLGQSLGEYNIIDQLGAGGMGAVYRAHHEKLDKVFALKVLLTDSQQDPESIERFSREARTAARLDHPNVVTIHNFGEQDGIFYLVMRYVEGENLGDLIRRLGRISEHEAIRIMREIAKGLAAAHDAGLIHRDIKPANILLSNKNEVLIADFGLAKPTADADGLTAAGTILRTPEYMSPEQCRGEDDIDGRSDLFSLGLVLYLALTGSLPAHGRSPLQIIHNRVTEDVPPIHSVAPGLSAGLATLVSELLARDPTQRIPSAQVLITRLEALIGSTSPTATLRTGGAVVLSQAKTVATPPPSSFAEETSEGSQKALEARPISRSSKPEQVTKAKLVRVAARTPAEIEGPDAEPRIDFREKKRGGSLLWRFVFYLSLAALILLCCCFFSALFARHS